MATTTLIPLHAGKGRTVAAALRGTTDYVKNPEKTNGGEWVTAYECDPLTADAEFLFAKNHYAQITGRDQGGRDVIGYHLRQSFKPGEIDPATANRIGYELALRLTHGNHAFVCCTHVDKNHTHSHIVISSISLDCTRKFRNFKGSTFAVRKISDMLCLENGLSIVEKPKPSKGKNYGEWLGGDKPKTGSDRQCDVIDECIVIGRSQTEFFTALKRAGVEIKSGKQLAFRLRGAKKFFRQDTLGDDYSPAAILERLTGRRVVQAKPKIAPPPKSAYAPKLLIDIEAKMQQGYGEGFRQYATIINVKEMARTLIFLKENGIGTYEELVKKDNAVSADYFHANERRKVIDARLATITELQKHIGNYGKGQPVYKEYRAIRNSKKARVFYEEHRAALTLRSAAKKYFDTQGLEKTLPSINALKQEYAELLAEKRTLGNIRQKRDDMIDWARAKNNTERILGVSPAPRKTLDREAR
jgi:hypothetical protein